MSKILDLPLIVKSFAVILLVVMAFFAFAYQNQQIVFLQRKEHLLRKKLQQYEYRLNNFIKQPDEIKKAHVNWLRLRQDSDNFAVMNLAYLSDRLQQLRKAQRLISLRVNIEKAQDLPLNNITNFILLETEVHLKIAAYTDLQILAFMDELFATSLGYFEFDYLQIKQNLPLNQEVLLKLAAGDKLHPVSAEIILKWRQLKEI